MAKGGKHFMFREFDRDFTPVEPHRYPVEPQET